MTVNDPFTEQKDLSGTETKAVAHKKPFTIDLENLGFVLVFWDFFFGIPLSYGVAFGAKVLFSIFGYGELLNGYYGIMGTRMLFVIFNIWILVSWAAEMERVQERKWIANELNFWQAVIKGLEMEKNRLEDLELRAQLEKEQKVARGVSASVMDGDHQEWARSRAKLLGKAMKMKGLGISTSVDVQASTAVMRTPKIKSQEL